MLNSTTHKNKKVPRPFHDVRQLQRLNRSLHALHELVLERFFDFVGGEDLDKQGFDALIHDLRRGALAAHIRVRRPAPAQQRVYNVVV